MMSEEKAVERSQEEMFFVCGSSLFISGPHKDNVFVREGISYIKTTYYAGKTMIFPDVCIHCRDEEVYIGPAIQQKKDEFGLLPGL